MPRSRLDALGERGLGGRSGFLPTIERHDMTPATRGARTYEEEYVPPPSHPLRLLLALGALVAATVACLVWFAGTAGFAGSSGADDREEVVDVVGMDEQAARAALSDAGFVVEVAPMRNVDVPAGEVFRQSPPGGTMTSEGTTIELVVSAGDEFVVVPQLYGSMEGDLGLTLFFQGLGLGQVTSRQDPTTQAGEVLEQDPLPGTEVPVGTTIDVVVSQGPPAVVVPDVTGRSQEDAVLVLLDAGFQAVPVQRYSSARAGQVISTDPRPGREAPYGSTITIYVSRGRAPTTTPPRPTTPTTQPGGGTPPPTTQPPTTEDPTPTPTTPTTPTPPTTPTTEDPTPGAPDDD